MRDKKNTLKLTTKIHSKYGIASFILGIVSIILFFTAVMISAFEDRNALQYHIGIIEVISLILSLIGITYGILGEINVENLKLFPHLGVGTNTIAIIFHILVIILSYLAS